jgi:hypothetical protein
LSARGPMAEMATRMAKEGRGVVASVVSVAVMPAA